MPPLSAIRLEARGGALIGDDSKQTYEFNDAAEYNTSLLTTEVAVNVGVCLEPQVLAPHAIGRRSPGVLTDALSTRTRLGELGLEDDTENAPRLDKAKDQLAQQGTIVKDDVRSNFPQDDIAMNDWAGDGGATAAGPLDRVVEHTHTEELQRHKFDNLGAPCCPSANLSLVTNVQDTSPTKDRLAHQGTLVRDDVRSSLPQDDIAMNDWAGDGGAAAAGPLDRVAKHAHTEALERHRFDNMGARCCPSASPSVAPNLQNMLPTTKRIVRDSLQCHPLDGRLGTLPATEGWNERRELRRNLWV